MEKETLKALKGSIKKWVKIEGSTRALDKAYKNCPLCDMFWDGECDGCPIKEETTEIQCLGSPYEKWCDHQIEEHIMSPWNRRHKDCPTCLELATKERKFLESLLPEEDNVR